MFWEMLRIFLYQSLGGFWTPWWQYYWRNSCTSLVLQTWINNPLSNDLSFSSTTINFPYFQLQRSEKGPLRRWIPWDFNKQPQACRTESTCRGVTGTKQKQARNSKKCKWRIQASNECFNPLKPELNPICYLLALLRSHHFLHVSRIRVKLLTFRLLMSYIWSTHSWCF